MIVINYCTCMFAEDIHNPVHGRFFRVCTPPLPTPPEIPIFPLTCCRGRYGDFLELHIAHVEIAPFWNTVIACTECHLRIVVNLLCLTYSEGGGRRVNENKLLTQKKNRYSCYIM